ncbi:MAG: enoyl-CoA hydratase/isomerase family protein [Planctomycetaceae bacterium]
MTAPLIALRIDAGIAELKLNRASKRNALTRGLLEEAVRTVEQISADENVRLLVVAADGPVFCAGMDLGEMQARAHSTDAKAEWDADARLYRNFVAALFNLDIPTLCVLQGPVVAGGVGIVAACDLVLASTSASAALPEPRRGIAAAVVTPLLVYRIGAGAASAFLLSGRTLPSDEMLRIGLCHFLCPPSELECKRREIADSILTGSPAALAVTKKHIRYCAAASLMAQIDASVQVSAEARETEDAREGLAAFLEKRDPNWVRRS